MIDPATFNDPRHLFELWKQLTGEDLLTSAQEKEGKREAGNDFKRR